MRLLLLRPCCFDLGGPLIGLCGHTEKLFCKAVRESRQSTGYGLGLIAAYGKVNDGVVNGIVSNQSAGVSQPSHCRRKAKRIDFFVEITAFCARCIDHAFNTDSQHCARCSRGQIDDALRLFEDLFGLLRHALGSGDSASCRENKFVFLKQSNSFAPTTYRNVVLARTKKTKSLIGCCFPKLGPLERVLINERGRTGS